mmetsp:Transcript_36371/g.91859  ORF Transcript_36371/g.91859 Transcript_36371/m.91859 type:complete len:229 (+) Transcript_36371:306-992(+)
MRHGSAWVSSAAAVHYRGGPASGGTARYPRRPADAVAAPAAAVQQTAVGAGSRDGRREAARGGPAGATVLLPAAVHAPAGASHLWGGQPRGSGGLGRRRAGGGSLRSAAGLRCAAALPGWASWHGAPGARHTPAGDQHIPPRGRGAGRGPHARTRGGNGAAVTGAGARRVGRVPGVRQPAVRGGPPAGAKQRQRRPLGVRAALHRRVPHHRGPGERRRAGAGHAQGGL